MGKPTAFQWATMCFALFALGLALGYMIGEIWGLKPTINIYQLGGPSKGVIPWGL